MSSNINLLNFNYQNKDYTFTVDASGELIPHKSLKGEALEEAKSIIPIAREKFQEALRPQASVPKMTDKNYQEFIKAGNALQNVEKLKNSTLKNLEKLLTNYLKEFQTVRRYPSQNSIDTIATFSNKLKTLSENRRKNVENKMGFLGKFFHKLAQAFSGGGWRTLAKRTDELSKRIDTLISKEKERLKKFDLQIDQYTLAEVAKDTELGRESKSRIIKKLNDLDEEKFKEMVTCFIPNANSNALSASFARIYTELSSEKKEIFNKMVLADPHWYSLANYHLFVEGNPVEEFPVDLYLEKFEEAFQQNFSSMKPNENHSHMAVALTHEYPDIKTMIQEKPRYAPKTYFNTCMQYLFIKKVERLLAVEKPNWGELIKLFEATKVETRFIGFIREYCAEVSKATLQDLVNEARLDPTTVQKIKDNIDYQSFGLHYDSDIPI